MNHSGNGGNTRTEIPNALPITRGSLADFPDDPVACMRRLHQQHGPIAALEEADQRIIFVFSP